MRLNGTWSAAPSARSETGVLAVPRVYVRGFQVWSLLAGVAGYGAPQVAILRLYHAARKTVNARTLVLQ